MTLTVLGCGTSTGVPVIGCGCLVCTSDDPRDRRQRTSLLIEEDGRRLVIDTGPDFRMQALQNGIAGLAGVLYTHGHADHVLGLDDLRPLSFKTGVDIWAEQPVLDQLERMFPYAFSAGDGFNSRPHLRQHVIAEAVSFEAAGFQVLPIRVLHGHDAILGFRLGPVAWITDCSEIPPDSLAALADLEVLFLDGLQSRAHPTHLSFSQAVETAGRIAARQTYLIHISHEVKYQDIKRLMPDSIEPAWDGLVWETGHGLIG